MVAAAVRLGVREPDGIDRLQYTHLVLCLEEDLQASGHRRRCPQAPPQLQEVGLQA